MPDSIELMEWSERYAAPNYHPLPIVIERAEGVWVEDPEGRRYMDMLSAYSAMNHGHRHPTIIQALKKQADQVTLTSRAFHSTTASHFYQKLAQFTGKSKVLAMNTGAEAVETAVKAARRWAYRSKGVPENQAEIIVCAGNFHGRTLTVTSFSSSAEYKKDFGPFTAGFRIIPYGDLEALKQAITPNTAAFLIEPIQGEAGIVIPPKGYIADAFAWCKQQHVLTIADEIQTGFGRTGRRFASDWEGAEPDLWVMGKALGGGVMPISAVAADASILDLFEPGSHGSTFGGNPLACAVAIAALQVLDDEKLAEQSEHSGHYFMKQLQGIRSSVIKEIRGRGLFIGVELHVPARSFCERLMAEGLLCKETHETTIRFAPPLTITKDEMDWALERIHKVLSD